MALLTVSELRTFVTTPLPDGAVQVLLDAAERAIVERYGATGTLTEVHQGGQSVLALKRPVASITSISETVDNITTVLASNDYLFAAGSLWLTRSIYGTHYGDVWAPLITVVYVPVDDTADRKRVQLKLVELDLNNQPGLTAQTVGDVSETFAANSVFNYGLERESILSSLNQAVGALFA